MAKKIAVGTLRELVKNVNKTQNKKITFQELEFEVKQYLPIEEKRIIVELVTKNSFTFDEEIKLNRFESVIKETMLGYFIARDYTNINTINDPFEMYDILKSIGLLDVIIDAIPAKEINQLKSMVEDRISEEYRIQEISTSFGYKLEDTIDILNTKMTEAINTMTDFDPKQLKMLTRFLDKDQENEMKLVNDNKKLNVKD